MINKIISQFSLHLLGRIGSALINIFVFSYIAKSYSESYSVKAFFFNFIFGFLLVSYRQIYSTYLNDTYHLSKYRKFLKLKEASTLSSNLYVYFAFIIFIIVFNITNNFWISFLSILIAYFAKFDLDSYRGLVSKASLLSILFAMGNLLTLTILYIFPKELNFLFFALICQWIPICLANSIVMLRLKSLRVATQKIKVGFSGVLFLSIYDGLILNAPYFFDSEKMAPAEGMVISLVNRFFISSLPMLSLLGHWLNSPSVIRYLSNFNFINIKKIYRFVLFLSGVLFAFSFGLIYSYISKKEIPLIVIPLYFVIFISYSFYISEFKFSDILATKKNKLIKLFYVVSICYLIALFFIIKFSQSPALQIILLQVCILVFSGLMFRKINISNNLKNSRDEKK